MSRAHFAACLLAGAAAAVFALPAGPAPQTGARPAPPRPALRQAGLQEVEQVFPVGGPMQTAWKVRYTASNPGPGLTLTGAWFKTSPRADWLKVLENLRLSEIFVPYNNGVRIYDIGAQGNYSLLRHTAGDAGPHGELLNGGLVVKEIRNLGILWKYYKD